MLFIHLFGVSSFQVFIMHPAKSAIISQTREFCNELVQLNIGTINKSDISIFLLNTCDNKHSIYHKMCQHYVRSDVSVGECHAIAFHVMIIITNISKRVQSLK